MKKYSISVVLLIISDYLLKLLAVNLVGHNLTYFNYVQDYGSYSKNGPSFDPWLNLGFMMNDKFAFGGQLFGFNFQIPMYVLIIISILAVIFLGYLLYQEVNNKFNLYSLSLIFLTAGAAGNLVDRILYGAVIDYIGIPFLPFVGHTLFNLADALLNVGIVLLIIHMIFFDRKEKPVLN